MKGKKKQCQICLSTCVIYGALARYSSSAYSMCTPSFCVVNLTNFDPFIGCLLYILGFISLWWWWITFVCWLAIHIAFKKVWLDSYHLFCLSFRLVIKNILLYVILVFYKNFWKFLLFNLVWPFLLCGGQNIFIFINKGSVYHLLQFPFHSPIPLINWLSWSFRFLHICFSSVNVWFRFC